MSFLNRTWNWFFTPKPKPQIVRRSSNTINLSEWRGEKSLVSSAIKVWNTPDFQMMMDTLKNEHPAWMVFNPTTVNNDMRAAHQGKVEGYTLAIANLEAMRTYKRTVELEAPTFEPE